MTCVEHTTKGNAQGYGGTSYKGKAQRLHRLAYCKANSLDIEDIKGIVVRHKCDNPRCINPEHLELGTHKDNMQDMTARARQAKGAAIGVSVLTSKDVLYIREHYKYRCKINNLRTLGAKFGVTKKTIQDVVSRKTWAHIH
jgi:hypothetical protein